MPVGGILCGRLYLRNFIFLLLTLGAVVVAQEPAPVNPWSERAQLLTDDLLSDTKALNTYDRAAFWGRLAEAWWKEDPQRARAWLLNGVKLVESSPAVGLTEQSCRLVAVRALLTVAGANAPDLSDRLTAILDKHLDRNNNQQASENATALVDAGLASLATNPVEAGKLGAKSLDFGFSFRLANLLWRLRNRDQAAGDALFNQLLGVAKSTREINLVSMLLHAAVQGPYSTDEHRAAVLAVITEHIHSIPRLERSPTLCSLAVLAGRHISEVDKLFPERAQRIRAAIEACTLSGNSGNSGSNNQPQSRDEEPTVEQYLKAAERAQSDEQKDTILTTAADWAAMQKDFERAIKILDSISLDGRKRLGERWDVRRWNHAASAACGYLKADDLPAMTRTIDNTPADLKAYVRLTIVSECLSPGGPINPIDLLGPARNELENAAGDKRISWYMSMVRLYAKHSPTAAPAVLTEAVTAINRTYEQKPAECSSETGNVFANSLFAMSYRLPASLLEEDDAGVRYALGSVTAVDKRSMLRLQLLKDVLAQKATTSPTVRTRNQ